MDRISTNLPNDNMQYYLRERTDRMNRLQNQIASQSRVQNLRDDPIAAAHSTRYRSYQVRLARYSENIQHLRYRNRVAEGYMQESVDMLQRAREIAIQGATGTYTPQDMEYMAIEIDEIVNEMVEVANGRTADGTVIFGGDRTQEIPFRAVYGIRADGEREMVTSVAYTGTIGEQYGEVAEETTVQTNFPGNRVFWAEDQTIAAKADARSYSVPRDGEIIIDGVKIPVKEGDTVHHLIERINEAGVSVEAGLDPVYSSLVLKTTEPHQIWIEDGLDSTVLSDLGVVSGVGGRPPANIAPEAQVFGGSTFDVLIRLRDELRAGDQLDIGGSAINGIDQAMNAMLSNLGRLGAVNSRLDLTWQRTEAEIPEVMAQDSALTDVDYAEAITDLRMLEYTQQAALGAASRVLRPSLLDFLK